MLFTGHYFDNYRLFDVTDEMIERAQQKLKVIFKGAKLNV